MSDLFVRLDRDPYVGYWRERFGLPAATFSGLSFYQRGRSTVWTGAVQIEALQGAQIDALGIPLLRLGGRFWKPTSIAIITFGSGAQENVVDLDDDEMLRFLAGRENQLEEPDPRCDRLGPGFVVARFRGVALGCGEWHGGTLFSRIPKGKRIVKLDL
jgi:NOL1/NOP2/fmu family ribosome biogenesis protein